MCWSVYKMQWRHLYDSEYFVFEIESMISKTDKKK